MKMWSIKVITLLLFCYARPLTGKVYFVSENFKNMLHWDPRKSSPEEKVLYSVQYKSDDMEQFQIKKECQNITALSCDLTAETASFYDVQYEARVFVNNARYGKTTRFKPLAETIFGPPILSKNTTVSSLLVNVTLPLGPDGVSIANIINRSTNGHSKSVIIYTLNITEPKWAALVNKSINGRFAIKLNHNQEYCGYVVYNTLSEWGRPESQKTEFCATLPDDNRKLLPWIVISAALPAIIIIMLGLCMWNYTKGGRPNKMPHSLVKNLPTQQNILQDPFEKLNISNATVCTPKPVYAPNSGSGGYSPQDIIFQDYTDSSVEDEQSSTLNPLGTSAQSSVIYSVVVVHVPADKDEVIQQPITDDSTNDHPQLVISEETWNTLATSQNLEATESNSAKPLMLDIVRNPNGQLMLSSLFSLLQSRRGDEVAPLPSERKPLLSDLIDTNMEQPSLPSLQRFDCSEGSDSGCDESSANTPTIYAPSQAIFESGYKQNWIPGIIL